MNAIATIDKVISYQREFITEKCEQVCAGECGGAIPAAERGNFGGHNNIFSGTRTERAPAISHTERARYDIYAEKDPRI